MPLSLHAATRHQGRIRGAGANTLRDASSRATKAFYPALSMCDMIFSGVFERYPRLMLAIVEFELAWAPHEYRKIKRPFPPVQSKYSNSPLYWRLRPLPAPALRLVFRPTLTDTHRQYGW